MKGIDLNNITEEDIHRLIIQYKKATQLEKNKIFDIFIIKYRRLVYKYAKKYNAYNVDFNDLVQECYIAILVAIEKYDISFQTKFSTYAIIWMQKYINECISNMNIGARIPYKQLYYFNKIRNIIDKYILTTGTEPTIEEIIKISGFNKTLVNSYFSGNLVNKNNILSLNYKDEESDSEIGEIIPSPISLEEECFLSEFKSDMIDAIDSSEIKDRNKLIVKMLFGLGYDRAYTQNEVSGIFGISQSQISRIVKKTTEKRSLNEKLIDSLVYIDCYDEQNLIRIKKQKN